MHNLYKYDPVLFNIIVPMSLKSVDLDQVNVILPNFDRNNNPSLMYPSLLHMV